MQFACLSGFGGQQPDLLQGRHGAELTIAGAATGHSQYLCGIRYHPVLYVALFRFFFLLVRDGFDAPCDDVFSRSCCNALRGRSEAKAPSGNCCFGKSLLGVVKAGRRAHDGSAVLNRQVP